MKRLFILFLFISVNLFAQDWNARQSSVTLTISADSNTVAVDLYSLFGANVGETPKLIGVATPSALTSTSMTILVYDEVGGAYKTLTDADGVALTITVAASKYIYLEPIWFAGISKFQLEMGSKETANRVFTIVARVY